MTRRSPALDILGTLVDISADKEIERRLATALRRERATNAECGNGAMRTASGFCTVSPVCN